VASWGDLERTEPDFAARVLTIFNSRRHKMLATLQRDGSPRISGIEVELRDGKVVFGMMPGSRKLADSGRDPRLALQAQSVDPPEANPGAWGGDAKLSGRAIERPSKGEHPPGSRFTVDIEEVVLTHLDTAAKELVVEFWHPGHGLEVSKPSLVSDKAVSASTGVVGEANASHAGRRCSRSSRFS
jgi:hypothetical protein